MNYNNQYEEMYHISVLDYMSLTPEQQLGGVLRMICYGQDMKIYMHMMETLKKEITPNKTIIETTRILMDWFKRLRSDEPQNKGINYFQNLFKKETKTKTKTAGKNIHNMQHEIQIPSQDTHKSQHIKSDNVAQMIKFVINLILARYNYAIIYLLVGSRVPDIYIMLAELISEVVAGIEIATLKVYSSGHTRAEDISVDDILLQYITDNDYAARAVSESKNLTDYLTEEQMKLITSETRNIKVRKSQNYSSNEITINTTYCRDIFKVGYAMRIDLFLAIRDLTLIAMDRHDVENALIKIFQNREMNLTRRTNVRDIRLINESDSILIHSNGAYVSCVTTIGFLKIVTYVKHMQLEMLSDKEKGVLVRMALRDDQVGLIATSAMIQNWQQFQDLVSTVNATYMPASKATEYILGPRRIDELVIMGYTCHFSRYAIYMSPPRLDLIGNDYIEVTLTHGGNWEVTNQCVCAKVGAYWDQSIYISGMAGRDKLLNLWLPWYLTGNIDLNRVYQESLIIDYDKIIVLKSKYLTRAPWLKDIIDAILTVCNDSDDENLAFAIMVRAATIMMQTLCIKGDETIHYEFTQYVTPETQSKLTHVIGEIKQWYNERLHQKILRIEPSMEIKIQRRVYNYENSRMLVSVD